MTKQAQITLKQIGPALSAEDFLHLASGRYLQVCRASVVDTNLTEHYLIVLAHTDATFDITPESVAAALEDEVLGTQAVLVTESAEGRAAAVIENDREDQIRNSACSVAVMQASWAWDENPIIAVRVNDMTYNVSVRHDGEYWRAVAERNFGSIAD